VAQDDILLPPEIEPESETIELVADSIRSFSPRFGRGPTQRVSFGDPRWRITRTYRLLAADDNAKLISALNAAQGGLNIVRTGPFVQQRGTGVLGTELLYNNAFTNSSVGWKTSAVASLTVTDRTLRVQRTATLGGNYLVTSPTLTASGQIHIARAYFIGANDSSKDYASFLLGSPGNQVTNGISERSLPISAGSTAPFFGSAASGFVDRYYEVGYATLMRCACAVEANATGDSLDIGSLPSSTSGIARVGDFIEIGGELKQLTSTLNSTSGGLGNIQFMPSIFRSPVNSSAVVFGNPWGRFRMTGLKWDEQYGKYRVVTLTLDEVYE
jgi:hypothetical protein